MNRADSLVQLEAALLKQHDDDGEQNLGGLLQRVW